MGNARLLLISLMLTFIGVYAYGQDPDGLSCATANPFCSDSSYNFPNFSDGDGVTAPPEPDYGCLGSEPNPIWYYMQIDDPGTMELTITQISDAGIGIDIDFAMWGPFDDLAEGCTEIMSGSLPPLQCSYSAASVETIGIGMEGGYGTGETTPPPAESGDIYVVILTNYSGDPGEISFEQTDGTATTDCSIINCGLTLSSNSPVCQGATLTLTAEESSEEGTVAYQWTGPGGFSSTNPNVSLVAGIPGEHTYTCTSIVTFEDESDTCVEEIVVTVYPTFINEETAEICQGEIYEWQGSIYYKTGIYTQVFQTVNDCDSTYRLQLTVNPLPDMAVQTTTPFICEGDEAIIVMLYPDNNYTYQWLRNGVPIPGATNQSYRATEAGEYRVVGTTDRGCIDTSRLITIFVNPPAVAHIHDLDVNTYELCIGDTIEVSADYFENYLYRWSPEKFFRYSSGNRQSEVRAVLFEPAYIKLKTFNEFGCTAEDSVWVNPVPCCDVMVPTAFSPNGDGLNDYFNIMLQPGQLIVSFQIFDRMGNMVYDNNNPQGWNGLDMNGNTVAQAVYFYRIVYSCTDKENYERKGDITLVR